MRFSNKPLLCLVVILIVLPAFSWGQQANVNLDYYPQKDTEGLIPFSAPLNSPEVHDDRTVTFRLRAPEAKRVVLPTGAIHTALDLGREPIPFVKGEDGIWTLTIGPLIPDMYAYHFHVDGVQICDPSNTYAAFTAMPPYSQLAEGKAEPMIIAIPNNQVIHRNHPKHTELTFDIFEKEMRKHVIPLVDETYSTIQSPKGRAISGLSMGGRHSMFVGFRSLDLFANFGILSAGDTNAETTLSQFLNDPKVNEKVDYLFVGQGTEEASGFFNQRVKALCDALNKHNIKHEYYEGGHGGHDWGTWRNLLYYRFLPNLWR